LIEVSSDNRWYHRAWPIAAGLWRAIFQVAIFIAALAFLQAQQPLLDRRIDHGTKILTISRAGFSPIKVRIFAIEFDVNFDRDATGWASLNSAKPINSISTRGLLLEQLLWRPWSSMSVDLKSYAQLPFEEWKGEIPSPYGVYCLALEARNVLSNQSVVEQVLTPQQKFPASMFGPMGLGGAMGGGYPNPLFVAEAQIKSECLALYDKMR
jgi:hypothetical protein